MGLFSFWGTKKKKLLELQRLVIKDSPNTLVVSEKELMTAAVQKARAAGKIVSDSIDIVRSTTNPDVFFSRLDLLFENLSILKSYEPYIPFEGSPSENYETLQANKQLLIKTFLVRYHETIRNQATTLKTARGKANRYKMFTESLVPYYNYLDADNLLFIQDNSSFE